MKRTCLLKKHSGMYGQCSSGHCNVKIARRTGILEGYTCTKHGKDYAAVPGWQVTTESPWNPLRRSQ